MGVGHGRIRFLDGLRGLAILLVVGFHYIGPTFAAKLPYGTSLNWMPLFNRGWIGVYLFFLISGYVIFMTLEKCATATEFLKRRWLRLFPAMLIASIAIFTISQIFSDTTPSGRATIIDLLPGFTFISDSFWHAGLHRDVRGLDGDFWTLYVEAGFYVLIAPLYFIFGWKRALACLIALWICVISAPLIIMHLPKTRFSRAIEPFQWAGVMHYGWFAAGALFYKAKEFDSNRLYGGAIILATFAAVTYTAKVAPTLADHLFLIGCVGIFAATQRLKWLQAGFESRVALFVGFVSYPLYLLHNEIGIGLMGAIAPYLPRTAQVFLPLPLTAFMAAMAWIVARYLEPAIRNLLKRGLAMPTALSARWAPPKQADRPH